MRGEPDDGPFNVPPARSGMAWVTQSFALLGRQAGRLLLIAVLMQIMLGLVQVPFLGILVILSVPGLSAGILEAFHRTAAGAMPSVSTLFEPLASRRHRGRLFALGGLIVAVSFICVSFVMGSTTEVDEALLLRLQQGDLAALEELDPGFMTRLFTAFLLSMAISGTLTFFAVPLVWFRDRRLGAALGHGVRALVRAWRALLMLGLGLLAVSVPVSLLAMLFMQLGLAGGVLGVVGMGLVMLLLLVFQLLLFGTQYCSFRELFGVDTAAPAGPPDDDGQLLA